MPDQKGSEAPDNSSRCAVVVLIGAAVVTMHVITLHPPGEVLERKLIVGAAADIDQNGIVNQRVRVHVPNAGHGVYEGAPFSDGCRNAWAANDVVLFHAAAKEAAAIDHQADTRKAGKGKRLKRAVEAAIALLVDHVGELSVRDSGVDVSVGKESVELCCHRDREQ